MFIHPVGPKTKLVYWFRRGLILVVGVLLIWGIVAVWGVISGGQTPSEAAGDGIATNSGSPTAELPPCSTASMALVGYQKLKVSAKQVFAVTITNIGTANCQLVISPETYSLAIKSGSDPIWSTGHCADWVPTQTVTLAPGKGYDFTINWPLVRSKAQCDTTKTRLKPGTYVATSTLIQGTVELSDRQVLELLSA